MADESECLFPEEELQRQSLAELDELAEHVRARAPGFQPPPLSPRRLMTLLQELLCGFPLELQAGILKRLRSTLSEEAFDLDLWKGLWYMLNYVLRYNASLVRRRLTGEFETDDWGLDWELVDAVRPFLNLLYRVYWRVEAIGLENVPLEGRALLVAHHSGLLPWDGLMIGMALLNEHPASRLVRTLYAALLGRMPFVGTMLVRLGQVLATVENGTRLLEQDELVAVFPEGYKGIGKPYRDRYKLARFGRGGFVRMALATQAPIIPVSVVGAEETYITLAKLPTLSEVTGVPFLPLSLTFPWLGLLGFVPLPTKWYIDFGQPILTDCYGPDAANDLVLVSQLTDQVRNTIQEMLYYRLARRRSVFLG